MKAYCFADGLILFGKRVPEGALVIADGRARGLMRMIQAAARQTFTEPPQLLVPGVRDAKTLSAKMDAMRAFEFELARIKVGGVTVASIPTPETVQAPRAPKPRKPRKPKPTDVVSVRSTDPSQPALVETDPSVRLPTTGDGLV